MDLSILSGQKIEDGAKLTLRHPVTDDLTDITLTVTGSDSARYRKASHKVQNRSLSRGKFKVTAEKLESNSLEIIASCVVSWKNVEDSDLFKKKNPECTTENVTLFFNKHKWAREQADAFIADRANFLIGV